MAKKRKNKREEITQGELTAGLALVFMLGLIVGTVREKKKQGIIR